MPLNFIEEALPGSISNTLLKLFSETTEGESTSNSPYSEIWANYYNADIYKKERVDNKLVIDPNKLETQMAYFTEAQRKVKADPKILGTTYDAFSPVFEAELSDVYNGGQQLSIPKFQAYMESILKAETSGGVHAGKLSKTGAAGPYQVVPETAASVINQGYIGPKAARHMGIDLRELRTQANLYLNKESTEKEKQRAKEYLQGILRDSTDNYLIGSVFGIASALQKIKHKPGEHRILMQDEGL